MNRKKAGSFRFIVRISIESRCTQDEQQVEEQK